MIRTFYISFLLLLVTTGTAKAQLEFTTQDRWLFLGADSVEGKRIISGIYVLPIDRSRVKIELDVLDNWIAKDSADTELTLDQRSLDKDIYFIHHYEDSAAAYRYTNPQGYELLLAKERHYEYYDGQKQQHKGFSMSYALLTLPASRKSYVRALPLMFDK